MHQPHETTNLTIIGGGMVGMTLAIACASKGLDVAVLDKTPAAEQVLPAFDGRVCAIAQGSKRILDSLGIWKKLAPDAEPILDIRVSDGDSLLHLHYDHRDVGDAPFGYIVENRHLRVALLERAAALPSLKLLDPVSVTSIERTNAHATVTLADGRSLRSQLLVGADGRNSFVRKSAGIESTEWSYGQTAIVCTIAHTEPHRGLAQERFLPIGPFAVLPLSENRSSLVWTESTALAPKYLALPEAEFIAEIRRRVGDYLGEISVAGPRFSYPLSLLHAKSYVDTRLALVGDAAHAIHPIAGQGVNLGFRDVAVLSELIVDAARLGLDIGSGSLLAHYQQWRRFDSVTMIAVTDGMTRLFSNRIAPLKLARDMGLALVNQMKPLKRFFMRHAMGMSGDLPRLMRGEGL